LRISRTAESHLDAEEGEFAVEVMDVTADPSHI
jgi:hypothetical protein